jgi:hypothetical protein
MITNIFQDNEFVVVEYRIDHKDYIHRFSAANVTKEDIIAWEAKQEAELAAKKDIDDYDTEKIAAWEKAQEAAVKKAEIIVADMTTEIEANKLIKPEDYK